MMRNKGDDRYCLKHTGTSGFGRSYKRPETPSDSGSEADEEKPRDGIAREDKEEVEEEEEDWEDEDGGEEEEEEVEEGAEGEEEEEDPPAPVPVRKCVDCGVPIDPQAEVWKTRCLDCWKNMRDSARKREREQGLR